MRDRRRIIMVCPAVPLPFGDTAARWAYVLGKSLLTAGHEVACLVVTDEPPAAAQEALSLLSALAKPGQLRMHAFRMRPSLHPALRKLRSAWRPFSELVYADGFRDALGAEVERGYDVLHLEQLWSGWIALDHRRSLLNIHHFEIIDWEGHSPSGFPEAKALCQMRRATRRIVRGARAIRVFTPRLLETARSLNASARYWVIPFALDPSLYDPQPMATEPVVGLVGSMHWLPSRSAAERLLTRIWPIVKRRVPGARLLIAGWNARTHLGRYVALPDVTIEENLAHPTEFFSRCAVLAYAPERGSGMKIKVLEAMAYGVPVVTTWEGVEGLACRSGEHCFVEDDDERFADRVCELLDDPTTRRRFREAARGLVEERYSPAAVMASMMEAYDQIARLE